jgi:flagellar biosynthetic protein FlhB
MSEDPDKSQKTEDATMRKLEQARESGDVPSSRELNTWIMLIPALMFDLSLNIAALH